jgi:uncharacterized protein (TIGR00297 family)
MDLTTGLGTAIVAGLAASSVVAIPAAFIGWLTFPGAAAAVAVGTVLWAVAGPGPWTVLIVFFVTSSALGHMSKKGRPREVKTGASGRRVRQVLANGGVAAILAVAHGLWPSWNGWMAGLAGALAAAAADTWATEIGALSSRPPRLLWFGSVVTPGTSGGMTATGTLASGAGAVFIAAVAFLAGMAGPTPGAGTRFVLAVALGGFLGALADSVLGATLQGRYRCQLCGETVEEATHHGRRCVRIQGLAFMDNDGVNLAATMMGAALAMLLA